MSLRDVNATLRANLEAEDTPAYAMATFLNKICPDIPLVDLHVAVKMLRADNQRYDTYEKSIKDLIMLVKLMNADDFAAARNKLIQKAEREVESSRLIAEQMYESFKRREEAKLREQELRNQAKRANLPAQFDTSVDLRMDRDELLVLIDKITYGSACYMTDYQQILAEKLERSFGLKIELRGWLIKHLCFSNYTLAQKVREYISYL
jgi:hypothetical protein